MWVFVIGMIIIQYMIVFYSAFTGDFRYSKIVHGITALVVLLIIIK